MMRLNRYLFGRHLLGLVVLGAVAGCMPQAQAPQEGARFLVYFDEFSANITPQAQGVIADAAAKVKATHPRAIRIEAHASATGSPAANQKLTETRSQVVADALQRDGLDPGTFRQVAAGQTPTGDTSVADRRVDIVLER
jgi:outer membrane protein OmpA-like peptidoglycan-associated protein